VQELIDKFGPTVVALNLMAVAQLQQKNYADAFQRLRQARDLARQFGQVVPVETLLNSMVALQHLRKPQEIIDHIRGELEQLHPNHARSTKQIEMNSLFDRCKADYDQPPRSALVSPSTQKKL